jgi:hypothetical protein
MRIAASLALALVVVGAASAARVAGTNGPDRLTGTARADTIAGLAGRDRLSGGEGPDFLHGGPGRDSLDAGRGADRVAASYDGGRDAIRCGPGVDVVNADLADSVAADCELVSRRLSRDPYTTADAQHETQVEPDSLTVGRTTVAAFQVARRHDGAATNVGFAVSRDDGRTWRSGLLPGLTEASVPPAPSVRATDPVVAYDATARVWLISTLALGGQTSRLPVSRSTDGFRWSAPVDAATGVSAQGITFDKNWLACDNGPASPFRGSCYLAYTDVLRNDRLAVVTSRDGGLTWSQPTGVAVTDAVGAFPVIQANGNLTLLFLWAGRRIGSAVSIDGGLSFREPVVVSEVSTRPARGLRFFALPSAAVDPAGRIWVTWHDCRFSRGCTENSIIATWSTDGRNWPPPFRVTRGRNAMLPALGVHPTSGRLAFLYHVVRPGNLVDVELLDVLPGRAFPPPRRLSAQTMRPGWMPTTVSGRMLADYVSVHYAGARPLAVWVLASEPVGSSLRQAVYATRG